MAANDDSLTLMGIPLEIRHNIFAMASVRDKGTKKVLRRWFEKMDVKEQVAKIVQDNPDGPAPRVVYGDESHDEQEVPDPVEDEDNEEGEDEEQDEEDGEENEDEDEFEDDEAEDEGQDGEDTDALEEDEAEEDMIDGEGEGEQNEVNMEDTEEGQDETVGAGPGAMHGVPQSDSNGTTQPQIDEDEDMSDDGETGDGQNGDEVEDNEGDGGDGGDEEGADESTDGDGTDGTAAPASPPRPVIVKPARKWRHIPKFLRISGCPPPAELLLACKDMSREVKDWFYDVTFIRIDVSGSFAHTSMFEEALSQLAGSELSPFKNIRKVELMFVWDTEWIRNDMFASEVFPAMLFARTQYVQQVLQTCATELRQVVVHWHDSINDNESAIFKYEVLDHLDALHADINVEEHYLEPGQKPRAKTIAGKKRTEFQNIADSNYPLN